MSSQRTVYRFTLEATAAHSGPERYNSYERPTCNEGNNTGRVRRPRRTTPTPTHTHTHRSFTFFARRRRVGEHPNPEASISPRKDARARSHHRNQTNRKREPQSPTRPRHTHARTRTPQDLSSEPQGRETETHCVRELLVPGTATVLHALKIGLLLPSTGRPTKPGARRAPPNATPGTKHHHHRTTRATVIRRIVKWSGERAPRRRQDRFMCKKPAGRTRRPTYSTAPMSGVPGSEWSLSARIRCDSRGVVAASTPTPHLG